MMRRSKTITYVSSSLSEDDLAMLINLYKTNKMKMHCYRMLAKRYRMIHLSITMASVVLTTTGVIVSTIAINPIPIGVLSGLGVMLQTFLEKSSLSDKKKICEEACRLYRGITNKIIQTIQGFEPYNHDILCSDISLIDGIVVGSGAESINGISKKYYKEYTDTPTEESELAT